MEAFWKLWPFVKKKPVEMQATIQKEELPLFLQEMRKNSAFYKLKISDQLTGIRAGRSILSGDDLSNMTHNHFKLGIEAIIFAKEQQLLDGMLYANQQELLSYLPSVSGVLTTDH